MVTKNEYNDSFPIRILVVLLFFFVLSVPQGKTDTSVKDSITIERVGTLNGFFVPAQNQSATDYDNSLIQRIFVPGFSGKLLSFDILQASFCGNQALKNNALGYVQTRSHFREKLLCCLKISPADDDPFIS